MECCESNPWEQKYKYDTPNGNNVMHESVMTLFTKTASKSLFEIPNQKEDGGDVNIVG